MSEFCVATFDASSFSSGIYIYRITAANGEKLLFNENKADDTDEVRLSYI